MAPEPPPGIDPGRYRALLEISSSILAHREPETLIHDLAGLLRRVLRFDFLTLVLHDPASHTMRLRILASVHSTGAQPTTPANPVEESPAGWVWQHQTPLILRQIDVETRWPRVLDLVRRNGIQSAIFLPLTTAQRRLGALSFGFTADHDFAPEEIEFLASATAQVAVAVDNALGHRELEHQRDQLEVLLEINNALITHRNEQELFRTISSCVARVTPHDYLSLAMQNEERQEFMLTALEFPGGRGVIKPEAVVPFAGSPAAFAMARREPVIIDAAWLAESNSRASQALYQEGIRSLICLPLITRNRLLGTLNIGSFAEQAFSQDDVTFLNRISAQVAIAVENASAFRKISALKDRLAEEKLYLEGEIRSELHFSEIVGQSVKFRRILKQVETVAPTPASVLILGETGTGKELIARAIHNRSTRLNRTFVKLNCAATAGSLLESELFGHERGAFPGATSQKIGRLELADGGSLFLDEVGEVPLELQSKLLRALQEKEFQRIGGAGTVRSDVRLISATNRDLSHLVAEGQFRADLYYTLNVFPLHVPPLRERRDDIPLLVRHFVEKYSRPMGKSFETLPAEAMERLRRYEWPGNVRELENLIERAVILSAGTRLQIPELSDPQLAAAPQMTLAAAERAHILSALKECNWVIAGSDGAAARLGLKRTTLQSRMKNLGIRRPR